MKLIENCIGLYMYRLSPWCLHGRVWELQVSVLSGDGLWLGSHDSGKNVSAYEMVSFWIFPKWSGCGKGGLLCFFLQGHVSVCSCPCKYTLDSSLRGHLSAHLFETQEKVHRLN
jgi:hypothetical protein